MIYMIYAMGLVATCGSFHDESWNNSPELAEVVEARPEPADPAGGEVSQPFEAAQVLKPNWHKIRQDH